MKLIKMNPLSATMGAADNLFALYDKMQSGNNKVTYFSEGYGQLEEFREEQKRFVDMDFGKLNYSSEGNYHRLALRSSDVEWVEMMDEHKDMKVAEAKSPITVKEGRFESPISKFLPEESKYTRFHLVQNEEATKPDAEVFIIMIAGTGETSKAVRLAQARKLATKHGWSSIILNSAFYGKRKPDYQKGMSFSTAEDIAKHLEAVKQEGAALGLWVLNDLCPKTSKVCFTGFSLGAGMGSVCAATCLRVGADGSRLAVASYVPTSSSGSLIESCLSGFVDWNGPVTEGKTLEEAKKEVHDSIKVIDIFSLTGLHDDDTLMPHQRIAVSKMLSMAHDKVVRRKYRREARTFLKRISHKVEYQVMSGGHVSASLQRTKVHNKLIEDTVMELLSDHKKHVSVAKQSSSRMFFFDAVEDMSMPCLVSETDTEEDTTITEARSRL